MPIGTEAPNIYPTDFRLKRGIYDVDYDQMAVNTDGSINTNSVQNPDTLDAFARLRVSEPYTVFDSKQVGDNQPLFYDDQEVSGGGTASVYDADRSSSMLNVSLNTAGLRVRQTKQRLNYQPGKSQLCIFTFVGNATPADITKEVGLFDDENGLFLRLESTGPSLVSRSYVSGAAFDLPVAQANWNVDTLDGNGASGVDHDFTKATIFFLDFEWLGVGTVRFGFFIDGRPVYVHHLHHVGVFSSVYMTTPNLPIRYSIENGGAGAVSSFEHICSTVISEGGVQVTGIVRSVDRGNTILTTAGNTLVYPLISIRLKAAYRDITVIPTTIEVFATSTTSYRWALILNPTVAGNDAVSWTSLANSAVEYDVTRDNTNTLTGGTQIASGYGSSTNQSKSSVEKEIANALKIGETIAGAGDELVLAVQNIASGAETYLASLEFRELQ